ncbi:hypothetical protein PG993_008719, partial [Apiospora rasikravindrae]
SISLPDRRGFATWEALDLLPTRLLPCVSTITYTTTTSPLRARHRVCDSLQLLPGLDVLDGGGPPKPDRG